MKHISILVPKGAILGSLEGTRQLFTQVNEFLKAREQEPLFKVQLVGLSSETPLSGGRFTANADVLMTDVQSTDLIVIPAIDGEITSAIEKNRDFWPWKMVNESWLSRSISIANTFAERIANSRPAYFSIRYKIRFR